MNNEQFFGEKGLTSTSANHIANLAKEFVQDLEIQLASINFLNTTVASILAESPGYQTTVGVDDLSFVIPSIEQIAKAKSLIAWLREAIKTKNEQIDAVKSASCSLIAEQNGIAIPVRPERIQAKNEQDYLDQLTVKERNKFLELETNCAVIGKLIHPNNAFSKARKRLQDIFNNPSKIAGEGRDTIIYTFSPSIKPSEVEDLFFKLQNMHREMQAELNGMKHKQELWIMRENMRIEQENDQLRSRYAEESKHFDFAINQIRTQIVNDLSELKIIIPNDLQEIYQMITKLGK